LNSIKALALSLLLLTLLTNSGYAATEFISLLKSSGGDYSSVQTWESQMDNAGDITNANCKVFSHSGIFGNVWDNAVVTGETSGATGVVIHATRRQILIDTIAGTFQSGERVKAGTSDFVILTNAGDSVIIVGEVDGTLSGGVSFGGFTTSATNKIILRSVPYNRHRGNSSFGSKITRTTTAGYQSTIYVNQQYVSIIDLIVSPSVGHVGYGLRSDSNNVSFVRNIVFPSSMANVECPGIFQGNGVTITAENNIVYNFNGVGGLGYGVWCYSTGAINSYNNTIYGNDAGYRADCTILLKNNISYASDGNDYGAGSYSASSTHNLSEDATAPAFGTTYRSTTVNFVNTTTRDLHLSSTDTGAVNKGTDTTTTANVDIDGFDRDASGVTWDLGADELRNKTIINNAILNSATIN